MNGDGNCSFCGKRHDEVFRLITGPTCKICSECVGRCANQIAAEFQKIAEDLQFRGPDNGGASS
jgi:ATP-dependent protease Clp ATPase subunit